MLSQVDYISASVDDANIGFPISGELCDVSLPLTLIAFNFVHFSLPHYRQGFDTHRKLLSHLSFYIGR